MMVTVLSLTAGKENHTTDRKYSEIQNRANGIVRSTKGGGSRPRARHSPLREIGRLRHCLLDNCAMSGRLPTLGNLEETKSLRKVRRSSRRRGHSVLVKESTLAEKEAFSDPIAGPESPSVVTDAGGDSSRKRQTRPALVRRREPTIQNQKEITMCSRIFQRSEL